MLLIGGPCDEKYALDLTVATGMEVIVVVGDVEHVYIAETPLTATFHSTQPHMPGVRISEGRLDGPDA